MKVITYSTMANTYLVIDEETKKGFIVDPELIMQSFPAGSSMKVLT